MLTFEFVVSDGVLFSEPAQVVVTVENVAPDVYVNALTPGNPRTLDNIEVQADTLTRIPILSPSPIRGNAMARPCLRSPERFSPPAKPRAAT